MFTLKRKLEALAKELSDPNNEILVLADEHNDEELLRTVAFALGEAAAKLGSVALVVEDVMVEKIANHSTQITSQSIDEIAALAEEFDASNDEFLQRQASVLDQVLLNMGVKLTHDSVAKRAQEDEMSRLRTEHKDKSQERSFEFPSEQHERDIMGAEAAKAIKESIKEYRPLETSLSTRYCPDHPGTSIMRVGDYTYQCPLDKKMYPWREGFTTMKGNKVPGTDVQSQTQALGDRKLEEMHFTTREGRLNNL